MIVVNEIHDFEEIPPQVQYFVVFGSIGKPITSGSGWLYSYNGRVGTWPYSSCFNINEL